jgi:crotonobetainyl-CoA:carnitine CoA-transferase CaiB-like acyl-CoA transferase
VNMRTAWADLCTGAMLATVIAAWALGPERGLSMAIDLSMAEVVAYRLAEFITAQAVDEGSVLLGNEIYPLAPNNVYRVSDGDEWLALTVTNDHEWFALNATLGNPHSLGADAYSSQAGRWEHRKEIDRALQERLAGENGSVLVGRLQDSKVRSSLVWGPETLIEETQLVGRGFFVRYEHPELGIRRNVGLPWKIVGEDRIPITFPLPPLEAREPRT